MRLVIATRYRHDEIGEMEAEPVVVEVEDGRVRLSLDDGEILSFDVKELRAALEGESLLDLHGEAA